MEKLSTDALKPRKKPRQARSAVTVEAIYQATIQVLLSEGSSRLTTTRVAERAGVSVGTLYQYFPHKQALLFALVEQHMAEYASEFEQACRQLHGQPLGQLSEGLVNAFIDSKLRQAEASRALYRITEGLDIANMLLDMVRRLQQACHELLIGALGPITDLDDVVFTLLTALNGTMKAFLERDEKAQGQGMLRRQLQALCRGYLSEVLQVNRFSMTAPTQTD